MEINCSENTVGGLTQPTMPSFKIKPFLDGAADDSLAREPVLRLTSDESIPVLVPDKFTPAWLKYDSKLHIDKLERDTTFAEARLTSKERHFRSRAYNPTPFYKTNQLLRDANIRKSASTSAMGADPSLYRRKVVHETASKVRQFKPTIPVKYSSSEKSILSDDTNRFPDQESVSRTAEKKLSFSEVKANEIKPPTSIKPKPPVPIKPTVTSFSKASIKNIAATWPNTGNATDAKAFQQTEPHIAASWSRIKSATKSQNFQAEKQTRFEAAKSPRFPVSEDKTKSCGVDVQQKQLETDPKIPACFPVCGEIQTLPEKLTEPNINHMQPNTTSNAKAGASDDKAGKNYENVRFLDDTIKKEQEQANPSSTDHQKTIVDAKEQETDSELCSLEKRSKYPLYESSSKVRFDKNIMVTKVGDKLQRKRMTKSDAYQYTSTELTVEVHATETDHRYEEKRLIEKSRKENEDVTEPCPTNKSLYVKQNKNNTRSMSRRIQIRNTFTGFVDTTMWLIRQYVFLTLILIRVLH